MGLLWWRKKLRTIWRVEKENKNFFLVGTAHFSPCSFKASLTKLIQPAQVILFEGPLDSENMAKVIEYGRKGEGTPSLYEALDPKAIEEIEREIQSSLNRASIPGEVNVSLFHQPPSNFLRTLLEGVRPWFGFFSIWSLLLHWRYSMDMEAYQIAQKFEKRIEYCETIEEQLQALDGIPFERIVSFLNHIRKWKEYQTLFFRTFLSGDLQSFATLTGEFPTRCESIVNRRDPVFFKKIKAFLGKETGVAFIGVIHLPGIIKMFREEGFEMVQEER